MKLTPQLLKSASSKLSSSFSFETDVLLNLSLEEVDSLPFELQNKLRNLQEEEDSLIKLNEVYTILLQAVARLNRAWRAVARKRDGIRKGVLELRERCLGAKEEEVEDIRNMLLHLNSRFMHIQGEMMDLNLVLDGIAQDVITLFEQASKAKAEHLSLKEEFMMQSGGRKLAIPMTKM